MTTTTKQPTRPTNNERAIAAILHVVAKLVELAGAGALAVVAWMVHPLALAAVVAVAAVVVALWIDQLADALERGSTVDDPSDGRP